MRNESPWLYELDKDRPVQVLREDKATDVTIVGAGIAGISTAFFTLKYTTHNVILVEANKLAHGATGYNAGQAVSYFERGFASLADEFGLELARNAQQSVESAWDLIEEMFADAKTNILRSKFTGLAGLSSKEQVFENLKDNYYRRQAGLNIDEIKISDHVDFLADIPQEYEGVYVVVPRDEIKKILETEADIFIAIVSSIKGCLNSALFCQEVLKHLYQTYPGRFELYEQSPIKKIALHQYKAIVATEQATIETKSVVLCTNGFENLIILNETGLDIDARYHHNIYGKVGYMAGYLEEQKENPTAISYYTDPQPGPENNYFYLTRRPYEYKKGKIQNLIAIGGPEMNLIEGTEYSDDGGYPKFEGTKINDFIGTVYEPHMKNDIDYTFKWHGLMGYTNNGVRMIGPEPQNPVLLYNLGCNGVGILPSIFGGRKISRHLAGEIVEQTIFDVPHR